MQLKAINSNLNIHNIMGPEIDNWETILNSNLFQIVKKSSFCIIFNRFSPCIGVDLYVLPLFKRLLACS